MVPLRDLLLLKILNKLIRRVHQHNKQGRGIKSNQVLLLVLQLGFFLLWVELLSIELEAKINLVIHMVMMSKKLVSTRLSQVLMVLFMQERMQLSSQLLELEEERLLKDQWLEQGQLLLL